MPNQVIAPAAINALKGALTYAYWYKPDLRSFLAACLYDLPDVLGRLNWELYKRDIIAGLVDFLARDQSRYQEHLLRLMTEVCRIEDFSHLLVVEDGEQKARRAEKAIGALKSLLIPHEQLLMEQRAAEERRRIAFEQSLRSQAVREALDGLRTQFFELIKPEDTNSRQARGYLLEGMMTQLFDLFDLDPKASFRLKGEQIDGAFTFDKTDYLFEAKWQKHPVDRLDLDGFKGKIERRLENTLGMFLSINGFVPTAVELHSTIRPVMILVDGSDLWAVLEGRIDLLQLLLRKRQHAAKTGQIFLPIHQILAK